MKVAPMVVRNAFLSPLRTAAIVLILTIRIGPILIRPDARSCVDAKINEVKSKAEQP